VTRLQEQPENKKPAFTLRGFIETFLSDSFPIAFSPFHDWLMDRLTQLDTLRNQKDCFIAPRESGKSHHVTFAYPLKSALLGQERFQLILSETDGQAAEKLENIRTELQMNDRLRAEFGGLCEPGDIWKQNHLKFRNGCQIMSFGQGGAIRGIKKGADRPSLVILDDTEGEKHAISAAKRAQGMRWLQKAVLKIGGPRTNFVMIGSAIHPDCMVIQVEKKGWKHRVFPALAAMPTRMDLWEEWKAIRDNWAKPVEEREAAARRFYDAHPEMNLGAASFWGERFSLYDLMKMWADDVGSFNTEMQGVPYDPSLTYFDPSYFEGDLWFDEWPKNDDLIRLADGRPMKLVALDPSLGDTPRSDYQAFVAWASDLNGQEYVDAWLNREDVPGMARRGIGICVKHGPRELILEANGFQRLLKPDLEAEAKRQGLLRLDIYEAVDHVRWDKGTRIESLSSPLSRGKIKFKRNSPGVAMLLQQLKEYPFSAHNDGPDVLSLVRFRAMQLLNR
jgi:predicted phage terminase large subunit-like protein